MRLAAHELETRGTVKNELAPLQTDKRHRSPNQGHDRENNRSDPDGEDGVVLGKEPGRTLLKRTRFARGGRLVSHGELPFFKTFGEVRDMYALSIFLTSFVVKMARRLPSGLSPRRAIYRVLRAGRASPCAWGPIFSSAIARHQSRSAPANADAPLAQALASQLRIHAVARGRVRRLDVGRGAPFGAGP